METNEQKKKKSEEFELEKGIKKSFFNVFLRCIILFFIIFIIWSFLRFVFIFFLVYLAL